MKDKYKRIIVAANWFMRKGFKAIPTNVHGINLVKDIEETSMHIRVELNDSTFELSLRNSDGSIVDGEAFTNTDPCDIRTFKIGYWCQDKLNYINNYLNDIV